MNADTKSVRRGEGRKGHGSERYPVNTVRLLMVVAFAGAAILGGKVVMKVVQNFRGKLLSDEARTMIAAQNLDAAAERLQAAMQMAPEEPAVLRAVADYLLKTHADPQTSLIFLSKLRALGEARPEDMVDFAHARLLSGDIPAARAEYEKLNDSEKLGRKGLMLLAKILGDEGQKLEANKTLRQAQLTEPDNPESRLRLALLDIDQPLEPVRQRALKTIWEIAGQADEIALQAIAFLASSKTLSATEAERLREVVTVHPRAGDQHRFHVLSAYLRLHPSQRASVLDEECASSHGRAVSDQLHLLRWLVAEGEHERVLAHVPETIALRSAEAFPIYAEALIAARRWEKLRTMLESKPPPPLSESAKCQLLAECHSRIDADLIKTRHLLGNVYRATNKSDELLVVQRAAQLAENLGLWDIAAEGYDIIATKNARMKVTMLTKVQEMAAMQKDGEKMLAVAEDLAAFRPNGIMHCARRDYLRLVLGSSMEKACHAVQSLESDFADARTPEAAAYFAVLRALAAYRIGDIARMRGEMDSITDPHALPPGPRAVMAGLLCLSGSDEALAFKIAEAVPEAILIPEELHFLKLAL